MGRSTSHSCGSPLSHRQRDRPAGRSVGAPCSCLRMRWGYRWFDRARVHVRAPSRARFSNPARPDYRRQRGAMGHREDRGNMWPVCSNRRESLVRGARRPKGTERHHHGLRIGREVPRGGGSGSVWCVWRLGSSGHGLTGKGQGESERGGKPVAAVRVLDSHFRRTLVLRRRPTNPRMSQSRRRKGGVSHHRDSERGEAPRGTTQCRRILCGHRGRWRTRIFNERPTAGGRVVRLEPRTVGRHAGDL